MNSIAIDKVGYLQLYRVSEVLHVLSPILDQLFLNGKNFFKKGRNILKKLLEVGQIEHILKAIYFHLIFLTKVSSHHIEEISGIFQLGKLSFENINFLYHLLGLHFTIALRNFSKLPTKTITKLSCNSHFLLAYHRLYEQV